MIEEIKFKSSSQRIDYLLNCISGIIPSHYSKMYLLDALYKEIHRKLNFEEEKEAIRLFTIANQKSNMVYKLEGWSRDRIYLHKEEFLNEIELYLRSLLGKYKHYSIQTKKKITN